jgi:Fe-S cluster biogenesis protein NfuA
MVEHTDNSCAKPNKTLRERVAAVIDMIRPALQYDGGDVELIDIDDNGVVRVRLRGACMGCPSASMTLSMGIERNLKAQVPEVTRVVCA